MEHSKLIRVAIVEDTEDIRLATAILVGGSQGFECKYHYKSGEDALEKLPFNTVDVVLMDINMCGISGIECIRLLKPKMPDTYFMIFTVYEDEENIFKALKAGAMGYLLKRSSPNQILDAIRDLFNGGSPMSSEIARRVVTTFNPPVSLENQNPHDLTVREREILDFLAKGFLYKEIAASLFISHETVKKHIQNIYRKLQVQTRTEALNKAFSK